MSMDNDNNVIVSTLLHEGWGDLYSLNEIKNIVAAIGERYVLVDKKMLSDDNIRDEHKE